MIKIESESFLEDEQNQVSENFIPTVSFGTNLQSNQSESNLDDVSEESSKNTKNSLMEIFNSYLIDPFSEYMLNCTSSVKTLSIESHNFYRNQNHQENFEPIVKNHQNFLPITMQNVSKTNMIKFSSILNIIESKKSPKNNEKLSFKTNKTTKSQNEVKIVKDEIKIEDKENIDSNSMKFSKSFENHDEKKSNDDDFLKLESKIEANNSEKLQLSKKRKTLKNISLSRKQLSIKSPKTINPENKISNKENSEPKITLSGLEFSKKNKKRPLKIKNEKFYHHNKSEMKLQREELNKIY